MELFLKAFRTSIVSSFFKNCKKVKKCIGGLAHLCINEKSQPRGTGSKFICNRGLAQASNRDILDVVAHHADHVHLGVVLVTREYLIANHVGI